MHPNLEDAIKAALKEKFIVTNACIKKKEISQITNLTLYLKELEKLRPQLEGRI